MKTLLVLAVLVCAAYGWVKEMENPSMYEGDIVLDPDEIEEHMKGIIGVYASIKGGRWPNGQIKYKIESSLNTPNTKRGRDAIAAAIAQYHKHTCLRFQRVQSAQGAHLSFYMGSGCSSHVGYRYGRVNRISLAGGCWRTGTVMHEIGHSIGLYHEQSRPDRDNYVKIIWANIPKANSFNFNKQRVGDINSLGTPYDYRSMMHYGGTAFGGGKMTIQTINRKYQSTIGQRNGFSTIDIKQIRLMYNCNGSPVQPATAAPTCKNTDNRCSGWTKYCATNAYVKARCKQTCRLC